MTTTTAILPAYNEEVSIGSVVLCTRKYADRVLVIDEGSTDRTVEMTELDDLRNRFVIVQNIR